MIKRLMKFAALAMLAVFVLTGCVDFSALTSGVETVEDDEPKATQPPLTDPMYTDRDALYQYYNQVNIGDLKDDIIAKFGEPEVETTDNGETLTWKMDDGYGFAAVFFDSGRLRAKVLYYDDLRQLGQLSAATSIGQFASLNSNYTYEMVCGVLGGRSMELAQIAQDSSADPEVKRVYVWCNEKGDCVQVLFKDDETLEQVTYSLADEG
ncbi:MAG: hypothetical protein IJ048_06280 [Clostridia bacterium]|nr:hypothetical protein [Clostridia bacterium]